MKELIYHAHSKPTFAQVDFGDNIQEVKFDGHVTETRNGVTEIKFWCRDERDARAIALLLNVATAGLDDTENE